MDSRVQLCAQEGSACPPLGWTMSNQLATYAPYQLRWYYRQAAGATLVPGLQQTAKQLRTGLASAA